NCNPEKSCRLFKAMEKGYIADRYSVAFGILAIRKSENGRMRHKAFRMYGRNDGGWPGPEG
ncbi:TPA: hypothetical protein ACWXIY_005373, partial [Escherichia coli]